MRANHRIDFKIFINLIVIISMLSSQSASVLQKVQASFKPAESPMEDSASTPAVDGINTTLYSYEEKISSFYQFLPMVLKNHPPEHQEPTAVPPTETPTQTATVTATNTQTPTNTPTITQTATNTQMYLIFLTYQLIEYFVTPKRDTYVPLSNTSKN